MPRKPVSVTHGTQHGSCVVVVVVSFFVFTDSLVSETLISVMGIYHITRTPISIRKRIEIQGRRRIHIYVVRPVKKKNISRKHSEDKSFNVFD